MEPQAVVRRCVANGAEGVLTGKGRSNEEQAVDWQRCGAQVD